MPEDPRILMRGRFTEALHSMMDANNPAPEATFLSIDAHDAAQRERIATLEADKTRLENALQAETKRCGDQLIRANEIVEKVLADNRWLREELDAVRVAMVTVYGGMGAGSAIWGQNQWDKGHTAGVQATILAFDTERKKRATLQPAAPQLSGEAGEFKCATCRDTKQVPFVYGQEYDCVMSTTKPCPDCSAPQPATEQPRIWRDVAFGSFGGDLSYQTGYRVYSASKREPLRRESSILHRQRENVG